jgi:hypothetical protein
MISGVTLQVNPVVKSRFLAMSHTERYSFRPALLQNVKAT